MTYTVHYWSRNRGIVDITGIEQGAEITEEQVLTLIREQKVNIMIHHVAAQGDKEAKSYCYIDDLNHRFQTR